MTLRHLTYLIGVLGGLFMLAPGHGHAADQDTRPLPETPPAPMIVFAASSLGPPLDEIAEAFEAETGRQVRMAYGSSAVLARQVANGAPADLYIGAHQDWTEFLVEQGFAKAKDTRVIAVNELVVAGPAGRSGSQQRQQDVSALLLEDPAARIAVGNTDHVPLGLYTKEALINLDLWDELRPRLAPAASARRTLAFVASGSLALGILFASDAASDRRVQVLAVIAADLHSPIRYVAVPLNPDAKDFSAFLQGVRAREVLMAHGFLPAEAATKP